MDKPTYLKDGIIIPSSTDYLAEVDRFLEEKFIAAGIDDSIRTDIAISVSELVNNAIRHGNKAEASLMVDIRYSITPDQLRIVVTDQGGGFDIEEVDNPIDDDNLMKEVGRGLFIVENFVDDVKISKIPGGGTRVEIVKDL